MDFKEIKQELQKIRPNSNIKFNLSIIDDDLTRYLKNFIDFYYKNILYLWRAEYTELSENTINLSGDFEVKITDTYFKINIYVINNSNLDYYITIQPKAKWLNEIGSDIQSFLGNLPVDIDFEDTLFIYSSNEIEKALLTYGERYQRVKNQFKHKVQSGFQVAARVKSDLLKHLNLPNDLFIIDENFQVFKQINFRIGLANLLDININELRITDKDVLNLDGELNLNFPNNENLNLKCLFTITPKNYQSRIQIGDLKLPVQLFLTRLNISNVALDITGSFENPSDFTYGVMGDFSIGDSIPNNEHDFSYSSLDTNEFFLKFKPSSASSPFVPVFIQAYIDELSMSKAIYLVTGINVNIDIIDSIKLYSTYIYYCSPSEGDIFLLNGVKAKKGIEISSGIKILGLDAYCEYSAIEYQGTSGRVVIAPISIGSILSIRGDSDGTPDGYTGPEIEDGGVELSFDSDGPEYFGTSVIEVNLLNVLEVDGKASYGVKGLSFEGSVVAGPINIAANCLFKDLNYFSLDSYMKFDALGFDIDFGDLGNLSVHIGVECDILFELINENPSSEFSLVFNFNGKGYHLVNIGFSFDDIVNLELLVYNAIKEKIEGLLNTALEWLKALFNELIKFGTDVINESLKIASILLDNFGESVKSSAVLLNEAGYEIGKIGSILTDGFIQSVEQIASIFKELNYSTEEIVNELFNKFEQTAEKIASILKGLHYEIKEISTVLKNILTIDSEDITIILNNIGYGASDVANVLKGVYGLGKDAVGDLLRSIGHTDVVDVVLGDLWGTVTGGGCRGLVPEKYFFQLSLERRSENYKLLALRDYRDNVMMSTAEGENFLKEYSETSDKILNLLNENETKKFLEDVYHQILITLVALIEREQNEKINNLFEEKITKLRKLYLNQ